MITEEQFEKIELQHGCGYWNVCDDRACPCHSTANVSQGYNKEVYARMEEQDREYRKQIERESRHW